MLPRDFGMDEVIIRKATIDDLPDLLRFQTGVVEFERPFDPTIKLGEVQYYDLEEMIAAAHIELLVAESHSQVIGSGYARIERSEEYLKHDRHAYLGFMYVEPAHRGKGVNKKIIEALKEWVFSQNVTEVRLEVYLKNSGAVRAYEKAGFTSHLLEMRLEINEDY